jgi:hypothetical protein
MSPNIPECHPPPSPFYVVVRGLQLGRLIPVHFVEMPFGGLLLRSSHYIKTRVVVTDLFATVMFASYESLLSAP